MQAREAQLPSRANPPDPDAPAHTSNLLQRWQLQSGVHGGTKEEGA